MCWVACGFPSGETKCGTDSLKQRSKPHKLRGIPATWEISFWMGILLGTMFLLQIITDNTQIPAFYIICGWMIINVSVVITVILRIGREYLIIDPYKDELILRQSGCCCMAYRNDIKLNISEINGFTSQLDRDDDDNDTSDYVLTVDCSNEDSYILYRTTYDKIHDKCYAFEKWWNDNKYCVNKEMSWLHQKDLWFDIGWVISDMELRGNENYEVVRDAYKKDKGTLDEEYKRLQQQQRNETENNDESSNVLEYGDVVELIVKRSKQIMSEKNIEL